MFLQKAYSRFNEKVETIADSVDTNLTEQNFTTLRAYPDHQDLKK